MPGNNLWNMTNRQLMVMLLRRCILETEQNGRPSDKTIWEAKLALSEVVRNKRPESAARVKESKRV